MSFPSKRKDFFWRKANLNGIAFGLLASYLASMKHLIFCLLILSGHSYAAVKTWTGMAGDGLWSSPANWNESVLPGEADDIILDNSFFPGNYIVVLPDISIHIRTITITPSFGLGIQLNLPSTNIIEPAVVASGPGYGLHIGDGGVFRNGSGLPGGESLFISDSIRIDNGGKYIHASKASHALHIVGILSSMPGTEKGIFEFDVPKASYTISASNRTYGTLSLSAAAQAGTVNYTCSGSNPLTLRGDLRIGENVHFSLDLGGVNGNMIIKGDYIQNGGFFNIASGMGNTTIVGISGNLIQSSTGEITQTNASLPFIELNGNAFQVISLAGSITGHVGLRMKNPEGALLLLPLKLPYKLELSVGKIISSASNLLTLAQDCSIVADSSSTDRPYIEGPLRKEGLRNTDFLFPVGKNNLLRWLELKNATGNFTVEYIRNDPHSLSDNLLTGLDHISGLEYWTLHTDPVPEASANIELSYAMPSSGGVTDPAFLHIAGLYNGYWTDAGHDASTGNFTGGSVVSEPIAGFAADFFTLASTAEFENPLPIVFIDLAGNMLDDHTVLLNWNIDLPGEAAFFEVLGRTRNEFKTIAKIPASAGKKVYQFPDHDANQKINYYRLKVTDTMGIAYLSKIIEVKNDQPVQYLIKMIPETMGLAVQITASENTSMEWCIIAMNGQMIKTGKFDLHEINNVLHIDMARLPVGIYQFIAVDGKGRRISARFLK